MTTSVNLVDSPSEVRRSKTNITPRKLPLHGVTVPTRTASQHLNSTDSRTPLRTFYCIPFPLTVLRRPGTMLHCLTTTTRLPSSNGVVTLWPRAMHQRQRSSPDRNRSIASDRSVASRVYSPRVYSPSVLTISVLTIAVLTMPLLMRASGPSSCVHHHLCHRCHMSPR